MSTEAKVIITAINRVGAGVTQAAEDLNRLGRSADQAGKFFSKLFAIGVGFGFKQLLKEVTEQTVKAGSAGAAFGEKLDTVKASFNNLLAVKGGLPEVNEQLDALTGVLQNPATIEAANSFFGAILSGAVALAKGLAETVGGLRELGVVAGIFAPKTQQERIDVIDKQVADLTRDLQFAQKTLTEYGSEGAFGKDLEHRIGSIKAQIEGLKLAQDKLFGPDKGDKPPDLSAFKSDAQKKAEAELASLQYIQNPDRHSKFFEKMEQDTRTSVEKQIEEISHLRIAVEELFGAELAPPGSKVDRSEQFRRLDFAEFQKDIKAEMEANKTLVGATIDEEQKAAKEAFDETNASGKVALDDLSQFAEQAARNIQTALADYLFDPFKDGLGGMLKGFLDVIRRMIAEVTASAILKKIFGSTVTGSSGLGGFLGGLFKGFAQGGSFDVGGSGGVDSQLVAFRATPGERVSVGGAGGGGVVLNYNIDARGATPDVIQQLPALLQKTRQQAVADMAQLIRRGAFT